MASVILINPPYSLKERYGAMAAIGATLPSLGLLTVAAVLRRRGHNVRVLDASAQELSYQEVLSEVKSFQPDVVGITAVTPAVSRAAKLAAMIKGIYASVPVILGGAHISAIPEKTLQDFTDFDCGVIGEGEEAVVKVVDALSAQKALSGIPGVVWRDNGKVKLSGRQEFIRDLDSLPLPAWDLLEGFPDRFRPAVFKYKKLPAAHIVSSRGCPSKCAFCDNSVFGSQTRFYSPEYVLNMIDVLTGKFGVKEIIFEDDQFMLRNDRVAAVAEGLLKRRGKISWSCSGRVNSGADFALLNLMKRSGCWQINYGIESGSQDILDFISKGITLGQVESMVRLTHQAGISARGYFILGFPAESEETVQKTIGFAKSLMLDDVSVFVLTPFPGTRMYDIVSKSGGLEVNYDKMNILDIIYTPRGFSKEKLAFYQKSFMREFYFRPRIAWNYLSRVAGNPGDILNIFNAGLGFLKHVR